MAANVAHMTFANESPAYREARNALPDAENHHRVRIEEARERQTRTYKWLDDWLQFSPPTDHLTLSECSAALSLFYADSAHPIGDEVARLKRWRAGLLALPPVKCCIDGARPHGAWLPPGAPGRDCEARP